MLRGIAGLLDACPSVARAGLSDLVVPSLRGVVFRWMTATFSLARVVSSSLGGLLSGPVVLGGAFVLPGLVGASFSLTAALIIAFGMPETRRVGGNVEEEPGLFAGLRAVGKNRILVRLMSLYALNSFANGGMLLGISLLATLPRARGGFGLSPVGTGVVFGWFGSVSFLIQAFIFQPLALKMNPKHVYLIGGSLLAVSTVILPFMSDFQSDIIMWVALLFALTVAGGGFMGALPTVNAMMANATDPRMRGLTQGTATSIGSLLRGISPFLGGIIFAASLSKNAPFTWFLFLGAVYMLCLSMAVSLPNKETIHEGEKKLEQLRQGEPTIVVEPQDSGSPEDSAGSLEQLQHEEQEQEQELQRQKLEEKH